MPWVGSSRSSPRSTPSVHPVPVALRKLSLAVVPQTGQTHIAGNRTGAGTGLARQHLLHVDWLALLGDSNSATRYHMDRAMLQRGSSDLAWPYRELRLGVGTVLLRPA